MYHSQNMASMLLSVATRKQSCSARGLCGKYEEPTASSTRMKQHSYLREAFSENQASKTTSTVESVCI